MRRLITLTITMLALTSFMAITALAQPTANPHFIKCSAGLNPNGTLNVCFKIAGLQSNVTLTITASAQASAVYACLNHGQQCPDANNKVSATGTVSATGSFTSDKNGNIDDCLTVSPPPPPTSFKCP